MKVLLEGKGKGGRKWEKEGGCNEVLKVCVRPRQNSDRGWSGGGGHLFRKVKQRTGKRGMAGGSWKVNRSKNFIVEGG